MQIKHKHLGQRFERIRLGFALVVTLSLMILMTVVAVGLLTLSTISLRSSSPAEAMAVARANAKLSLILAIGELQRHTGLDTRVTARADILAKYNPPVLGVWRVGKETTTKPPVVFKGGQSLQVVPTPRRNGYALWLG